MDQDEELQDVGDEENSGDVPDDREDGLESEYGVRAVSAVHRQFTPQRPERPLAFMTPQVPKANGGLSLADRVRGRVSMSVGRANVARSWQVPVPDPDDSSPSKATEPGQQRVSDLERQVCTVSELKPDFCSHALCRLSRSEDVLLWLNLTCSLEEPSPGRDAAQSVLEHRW